MEEEKKENDKVKNLNIVDSLRNQEKCGSQESQESRESQRSQENNKQ
jgi:hypothetical protein